jgi:hypothetical protein|uniref:Uncharacterized protein n=1 Tax=viral metagenome TaxID=1070528 RepID=A0A6C0DH01_9ZZZZ
MSNEWNQEKAKATGIAVSNYMKQGLMDNVMPIVLAVIGIVFYGLSYWKLGVIQNSNNNWDAMNGDTIPTIFFIVIGFLFMVIASILYFVSMPDILPIGYYASMLSTVTLMLSVTAISIAIITR